MTSLPFCCWGRCRKLLHSVYLISGGISYQARFFPKWAMAFLLRHFGQRPSKYMFDVVVHSATDLPVKEGTYLVCRLRKSNSPGTGVTTNPRASEASREVSSWRYCRYYYGGHNLRIFSGVLVSASEFPVNNIHEPRHEWNLQEDVHHWGARKDSRGDVLLFVPKTYYSQIQNPYNSPVGQERNGKGNRMDRPNKHCSYYPLIFKTYLILIRSYWQSLLQREILLRFLSPRFRRWVVQR